MGRETEGPGRARRSSEGGERAGSSEGQVPRPRSRRRRWGTGTPPSCSLRSNLCQREFLEECLDLQVVKNTRCTRLAHPVRARLDPAAPSGFLFRFRQDEEGSGNAANVVALAVDVIVLVSAGIGLVRALIEPLLLVKDAALWRWRWRWGRRSGRRERKRVSLARFGGGGKRAPRRGRKEGKVLPEEGGGLRTHSWIFSARGARCPPCRPPTLASSSASFWERASAERTLHRKDGKIIVAVSRRVERERRASASKGPRRESLGEHAAGRRRPGGRRTPAVSSLCAQRCCFSQGTLRRSHLPGSVSTTLLVPAPL